MNKYLLALSLMTASISASASTTVIDNFNGGNISVDATGSYTNDIAYAPAFGGSHKIKITSDSMYTDDASAKVRNDHFKHNADDGISAISTISWGTNASAGIAITEQYFALDFFRDQGDADFLLTLSDADSGSSVSFAGIHSLTSNISEIQFIALASFSGIDFDDVRAISLEITGGQGTDITIDSLTAVPTPSALILLSIGLATFGFNSRKIKA